MEATENLAGAKLQGYDYKQDVIKKSAALENMMHGQDLDMKVDDIDKLRKALKQQEVKFINLLFWKII